MVAKRCEKVTLRVSIMSAANRIMKLLSTLPGRWAAGSMWTEWAFLRAIRVGLKHVLFAFLLVMAFGWG